MYEDKVTHYIPLIEICETILKETVLDIFFLLSWGENVTKKEIAQKLYEADGGVGECPKQKYRFVIENSIAKLEGALLISSYSDTRRGGPEIYFLSNYGESMKIMMEELIASKSHLVNTTKILKNYLANNMESYNDKEDWVNGQNS